MNNIFKKIDSRLILLGGIVIIALLLFRQCEATKSANATANRYKNNIAALSDSIKLVKTQSGKLQYEKSVLVADYKELQELNSELADEIADQKGKVAQLTKLVGILSTPRVTPIPGIGSTTGTPCDSLGGTFQSEWHDDIYYDANNWRILSGKTVIDVKGGKIISNTTEIKDDKTSFDLVTGLIKRDNHYEIFVRSNYPGFKPSKIDGAVIPVDDLIPPVSPKPWSVGVGPQVGVGISNKGFGGYIGLGISLQYTLLKF